MNPADEAQFDNNLKLLLKDAYASQQHAVVWLALEWFSNCRIDDAFLMMSNAIDATQNETVKRVFSFFSLHREIIEVGYVSKSWLRTFRKCASISASNSNVTLSEHLSHLVHFKNQINPSVEKSLSLDRMGSDQYLSQRIGDHGSKQETQLHSSIRVGKSTIGEPNGNQSVSQPQEVSKSKQKPLWSFFLGLIVASVVIAAVLSSFI